MLSRTNSYHIFFVILIIVLLSLAYAASVNEPIGSEMLSQIKDNNPTDVYELEKNRMQVLFMKERGWYFIVCASLALSFMLWISLSNRKRHSKSYLNYKYNLTDKISRSIKEHLDFQERLHIKYAQLTTNDILIAEMLMDGLSSKAISCELNISPSSVNTARYRLRKKMRLSPNDDLLDILKKV